MVDTPVIWKAFRALRPADRLVAITSPHHQLGDEVVVVLADRRRSRRDSAVDPDSGSAWFPILDNGCPGWAWNPAAGSSALIRNSIACPRGFGESKREVRRPRPQLLLDEVDASHHLGDGVFHLDPRVHLEEEEFTGCDIRNSTVPALT